MALPTDSARTGPAPSEPLAPPEHPEPSKHLVLVGMMGAGKSRVGRQAAKLSGRAFADSDSLITRRRGLSIAEIFEADGEAAFRDMEHVALAQALATSHPAIVATGGGVVLRADNREMLSQAEVVWLQSSPAQLADRLSKSVKRRPLLEQAQSFAELEAKLAEILTERAGLYDEVADRKLDVDELGLKALVHEVVRLAQTIDGRMARVG